MSSRTGRNDPCPCGSGKKYKRCHLPLDRQRESVVRPTPDDPESPCPRPDVRQLASFLQALPGAPKKERTEFGRLLAKVQPLLTYLDRREEIEAASAALEAHREEFDRLTADAEAYLDRSRKLFAEERFAPLRFTAADVRRAFESSGWPSNLASDDVVVETLRAAILYLADPDRRRQLALELLLRLPDYVAAGRHLDGWMIQECSWTTVEVPAESNPFLFQMFSHGYDACMAEKRGRDEALLRKVGLDPARLQTMSLEEIDAWLEEVQADPATKARMEAVLEADPEQRAQMVDGLKAMERDSIRLLERADARALLVPAEEVEPWLPILERRWESAREEQAGLSGGSAPDAEGAKRFAEAIWPVMGEMAKTLFTPERIRQLVAELRQFRSDRFAAGDKAVAGCAQGAIASLESEPDPAHNYFLNALCFVSLRACLDAMEKSDADDADSVPPAESAH